MKSFLVKMPEGMLARWKKASTRRKVSLSQLIRDAVNRDIDAEEARARKDGR